MELVVDTNILVSFFRKSPVRTVLLNPNVFNLRLYTPEHSFKELLNVKSSISKYSSLPVEHLTLIFEELQKCVIIIPDELSKEFEQEAMSLSPHDKDIPIFTLALRLKCAIWSNEPAFNKQSAIQVFNTRDLLKDIGYFTT